MSIPQIIEAAAVHYGLPAKVIRGRMRSTLRRRARDFAIRLLVGIADLDPVSVASCMDCDRQTVSNALCREIPETQFNFELPVWTALRTLPPVLPEIIVAFPPHQWQGVKSK